MQLQGSQLSLLPKRPRGHDSSRFKSLKVVTNQFKVQLQQFDKIYLFSVSYSPKIAQDNLVLRRRLLEQSKEEIKLYIQNPVLSTSNIYSTLPPRSQNFVLQAGDYRISVKKGKEIDVKQNPKLFLNFLNNGLRNVVKELDCLKMGQRGKCFTLENKLVISNLMTFRGNRSNFKLLENGYFLTVDIPNQRVHNQTVMQFIENFYKLHQNQQGQTRRGLLQRELIGKFVRTNYGIAKNYKISDVLFQDIDCTMVQHAGKMSIRDYYEKVHGLKITNKKQPLLKVGIILKNKKEIPILLIPEFCFMAGMSYNFDQVRNKKISESSVKSTDQKQREIMNVRMQLEENKDFCSLKGIGLKIGQDLQTIQARIIPIPKFNLGEGNVIQNGKQAFHSFYNKPIFDSKYGIKCAILQFQGQETKTLLRIFESTSKYLKVKFQALQIKLGQFQLKRSVSSIEEAIKKADENKCNICFILLPKPLRRQYKKLKNIALVKYQMVCQMMLEATLSRKNVQSIAAKILLQMIAKTGNTLQVPEISSNLAGTMLIAFQNAKSITGSEKTLAMCATIDSTFSSIVLRTQTYENAQSKFNGMLILTRKGIDAYIHKNNVTPSDLIFFHNSLTEDQITQLQECFLKPLKLNLQQDYKAKTIAITMVLVKAKPSERFFTNDGNSSQQLPTGTVIPANSVSNSGHSSDFYIFSQHTTKGPTVPNHYRVIYSDSTLQEKVLQELVFSQSCNSMSWAGSLKIPVILKYAAKCAKFNSQFLQNVQLSDQIQNKLYFV